MTNQEDRIQNAINHIKSATDVDPWAMEIAVEAMEKELKNSTQEVENSTDTISRQAAIDALWKALYAYEDKTEKQFQESEELDVSDWIEHRIFVQNMSDIDRQTILALPSTQPERKWTPCSNPPKHHRDVLVRGIEAIGNVTVHKVMQWDVDTWRPTDYAPSIIWEEWSEI